MEAMRGIELNKLEAQQAMVMGKILTDGKDKMYFDSDRAKFMYKTPDYRPTEINACWVYIEDFSVIRKWHEDIPEEGYPCWVYGDGHEAHKKTSVIKSYCGDTKTFYSNPNHIGWSNAEPIKPHECYQGKL